MRDRILLVGEAPAKHGKPNKPLSGTAMRSLIRAAGLPIPREHGVPRHVVIRAYAETFAKVNLIHDFPKGRWPTKLAQERARELWNAREEKTFILLGRRVSSAFCVVELDWFEELEVRRRTVYAMPHPSGLNRWWNDLGNRMQAQAFLFPFFVPALERAVSRLRRAGSMKLSAFYARLLEKGIS